MITLIHDLVIDVNQNNYTLIIDKHKKDKKGNDVYETIGYYGNLVAAIYGARDYYIRKQLEVNTFTLSEAVKLIKQSDKEFLDLLDDIRNKG